MPGQLSVQLLLTVLLAPLAGALLAGLFGTRFCNGVLGRKPAQAVTIAGAAVSCACSLIVLQDVMEGARFDGNLYTWMVLGKTQLGIGLLVDPLSAMMMAVVTAISLLVHIYSVAYMADEDKVQRFFAYLSLFTFSMLALVMGNNIIQLFFGWEAVGVMSYLLIGYWLEKPDAVSAGLKAFLVNRIGDFGFIIGVGLLFAYTGSIHYQDIFNSRHDLAGMVLPGLGIPVVTAICLFLFIGAIGKSAQFPLHVWLPDSMEGPTPVSALIHAATMVTAGIFMVSRLSPLYELSDTALSVIVIIGAITALFLGLVAMVQSDIKRVIAFSTLSQLGYMVTALGASAYSAGVFHLMTHAFFKALLFLAAGSVILSMHHDQDIHHMGGLRKYMPWTYITMLVGSLALVGAPFFAGFYSKESIVSAVCASTVTGSGFAAVALILSLFVTGFYTFRLFFLVFHGKKRFLRQQVINQRLASSGATVEKGERTGMMPGDKPQEQPWLIRLPLLLLAIPSAVIGFITVDGWLFGGFFKGVLFIDHVRHPAMAILAQHFEGPMQMALHELLSPTYLLVPAGIVSAWYLYQAKPELAVRCYRKMRFLHRLLYEQYYLNQLYQKVVVGGILCLGHLLWQWIEVKLIEGWIIGGLCIKGIKKLGHLVWKAGDVFVIDGFIVNGSARLVAWTASIVRHFQTGYIYHYIFVMIVGLLGLLFWMLPLALR
ncbi:MAG: NADH-quinone oxidoreductase subunit L [Oxalobacter sp.]|nr:NADH-quinone oxidoreductase subunit L [Oxalobacter sp.]